MPLDILNKFTHNLKKTLSRSIQLTLKKNSPEVKPLFLLFSLSQQKGSLAANILQKNGLSSKILETYLGPPPQSPVTTNLLPEFSIISKEVISKAALIAQQKNHYYIGTEHLLKALIQLKIPEIQQILKIKQINIEKLEKTIEAVLKNTSGLPKITSLFEENQEKDIKTDALEFFGTNLTAPEMQKNIDPVIGRQTEIDRLIHILSRRTKNNPVLIGEAGVGKTAIIEGLAKRILEKKVPEILLDKKIYRLDLSLVVAGTMYRGEFESRFQQIIEELQSDTNIILFIDELHTLMGAGNSGSSNSGAMDAANIIKPALAKGELRCIGATTINEYRKHIESDPALERRFQPILVEEPSTDEALQILKGIRPHYEKYHQIKIEESALKEAVNLSTRYIQDKFLPDKAIDLIDEAAAKAKINQPITPVNSSLKKLEEKIKKLNQEKTILLKAEKIIQASKIKNKKQALEKQLAQLKTEQAKTPKKYSTTITSHDIAAIVSNITGLPLGELIATEKNKAINLEKELNKLILGQTEATQTVANFIKRSRAGLSSPNRPLGSFIFLGPSGVGKTELAKVLAQKLFGNEKSMLRLDMSEFKEGFNISKLIGAPAGYIGYKEGAKLTDFVKRKPYSVILFDEIEKANPDIFNLLLQILEDGHLTDATGKKINFKNTIIIMTSNIGLKEFSEQASIGFDSEAKSSKSSYEKIKTHVLEELKKEFRPEFINRLDKTIVFKPLTANLISKIAQLQLNELKQLLKEKQLTLKIDSKVYPWLTKQSFSPSQGARALRKIIQEKIADPLAEKILTENLKPNSSINISLEKNKLKITLI